ncbi:MAG TPA: radical SAM protein, partial [Armatimonadota bacterium]|nr:radical SAM protein [Armatimonadota bacterium]
MTSREQDYRFHALTVSLCSRCGARVSAKIVLRNGAVYLRKTCLAHGIHEELLEEDADFYLRGARYDKPGTRSQTQTLLDRGCPDDCGLCPDHEQHTCIGLLEVTPACDLGCPVCFAEADAGAPLPLETIRRMLDAFQEAEHGEADVLQLSGGEPARHPDILAIIRLAREMGIRYVMLNTNGLRLADDPDFAAALGEFRGGFEVYLQFDGLDDRPDTALRGRGLAETKRRALAALAAHRVPATLVTTVQGGVNDDQLGAILTFAMAHPTVRGVNVQPLAFFGRHDGLKPADRLTRTGVLRRLTAQMAGMLTMDDFLPLPCD